MSESPDKLTEALREWERVRDQIRNNGKAFLRAEDTEALEWFWWNHGRVVANAASEIPALRADRDALAAKVVALEQELRWAVDYLDKARREGYEIMTEWGEWADGPARAALAAPAPGATGDGGEGA